jgi:hypothetical protein
MTESEFAALLRSQRTQTQEQVDRATREHDRDDLTPAERLSQFGM